MLTRPADFVAHLAKCTLGLVILALSVACTTQGNLTSPMVLTPTAIPSPVPTPTSVPTPTLAPTQTRTLIPTPKPLTPSDIFAQLSSSIVFIETPMRTGSGVLIDGGLIVTNAHVVENSTEIELT